MVYLDHNASSTLRACAREVMLGALAEGANASSVHGPGRRARSAVERAREQVARFAGAQGPSVVFTSGATEANALALNGAIAGAAEKGAPIRRVLVSAVEHDSVRATARALADGITVHEVPVDGDGRADIGALRTMLAGEGSALVSVMAANNETGVIQDIAAIGAIIRGAGALFHIDAVQAAGRLPIDFTDWGADYLTLSSHKIGGPQGAGALIVRPDAPLAPRIRGGGQEMRRRAGTENVAAIAGFGAATAAFAENGAEIARLGDMRDAFERALRVIAPETIIFGEGAPRLPNTSNLAIPNLSAETALIALDLDGVAVSSGSACSSGKVTPSHVLAAMGVDKALARSAIRVSFGWSNEDDDYEQAIRSIARLIARRRAA
jgi:cysteine desulfurase